jgi:hypothetical protein
MIFIDMKNILLYLILIMAVGMAGTVAYVSVSGLLKVFTGAGTLGLMLFCAIEMAKMIATSAIHTYGKKIGWFYNSLLSIAILISMVITSMGIYGFLSSSYKESFAKMENVDSQVLLLETKRDNYQEQLTFVIDEKTTLNQTIGELSKGLANNVIQYTNAEGQVITTTSRSTRRALEKQLDNAIVRQTEVNVKSDTLNNIIFDLENEILETKLGNDAATELSTLKYLADITGKSMDEVMKWFILLLIIIGDPMAVLMVIVFNKVVKKDHDEVKGLPMDSLIGDKPKEPIVDPETGQTNLKYDVEHTDEDIYLRNDGGTTDTATGHIDLSEDALPMEEEPNTPQPEEVEIIEEIDEEHLLNFTKEDIKKNGLILKEELIENTPAEQIEENIVDVKQLKREPIIPRGKIIEADLIKTSERGFSVKIPEPKVTPVGSQKEIHEDKPNTFFFKRKRRDELGNI